MYECNFCNYITKDRSNLNKHFRSKKHIKNTQNKVNHGSTSTNTTSPNGTSLEPHWNQKSGEKTHKYECTYCNNIYSRANSLARHKKACGEKHTLKQQYETRIKELSTTVKLLKKDKNKNCKFFYKELDHYKEEAKYYRYLFEEAGGIVKKSISSASYIQQTYVNAPPIKPLSIKDLIGLEQDKKKLANNILYTYRHDTIDKYIGDQIIAICTKENPYKQFIWNTDSSRFTYMIRNVINKVSVWQIDKGGLSTSRYLIDPIMLEIKELMINHYKTECQIKDGDDAEKCIQITNDSNTILNIIENINDKIINNKILRYITPPFAFRKDLIK
jgi:hypothetical protein